MKGVVYKSTGSWYTVKATNGVFYECKIKGKFRIEGIKSTNPVAAGDHVAFEVETKGDETIGIINKIDTRNNYIIRKSVNLSKQTHIIAANVDIAFLLVTLNNPPTFTPFIDRFLVTAQAYHIKAVLLFNKIDTYNEDQTLEIKYLAALYRSIGYECVGISAKTGKNIDKVKQMMRDKVSMFSGHSGVGKSTLVNTLEPTLELKTSEMRASTTGPTTNINSTQSINTTAVVQPTSSQINTSNLNQKATSSSSMSSTAVEIVDFGSSKQEDKKADTLERR